ncbi:MAG TPA: NUDIX hydrolase [Pseudomonadales bacterium]
MSFPDQWLDRARRLRAIAQIGQTYTRDQYDRERFDELAAMAHTMLADLTGAPLEAIVGLYIPERGYATPKVDVRAGVFHEDGRVLLVREASDGCWALPGGWADEQESPKLACEREVFEESGYRVRATKLAAIKDRSMHPYTPARLEHIYKLFFVCDLLGGAEASSIETTGAGFFPRDALPPLSLGRTLADDVQLLWSHRCDASIPTYFD